MATPTEPLMAAPSDLAKRLIEDALAPVADDLHELSGLLPGYLPTEAQSARKVVEHVFSSGGKRIRPALYFMACRVLGYRGDHYFPIAAVTEFVHTASLLHDDVIDNSTLRRNKPTANSIYGDQTSVLVGDLIYSTASEMMAATGNLEIVRTFARAIRLMSDGELQQLENIFNVELTERAYLRILECKTAVLIEAACKSAGLLAGAPAEQVELLNRFGYGVGMAFQLIDDALDYTGAASIVGKSTLSDLLEGRITMPVIMLLQRASPADRGRVIDMLNAADPARIDGSVIQEIARLVEVYDTAEGTVERAQVYTDLAMSALQALPDVPERDMLENLANKLLYRFN